MSKITRVYFDDSLPTLLKELSMLFSAEELNRGLVVRDTSGRLRFLSAKPAPSDAKRAEAEGKLFAALGAYARKDSVIAYYDEPGVQTLLEDPAAFPMEQESITFRFLDRRIVGSAWIDHPQDEPNKTPRIVFASLKGGVGRTTALAITAADLARRNKNILAIDLDLEAPGLGDMLLDEERAPLFGSADYLVEDGLGGIPDQVLSDFVGTSNLTTAGGGRVDVVPVLGKRAIDHPENVLPKLSRAMIEDIDDNGGALPVTIQIAKMVDRITRQASYDVVLIDSRAGLSELAAPAILGLGANVLLFGTAQRQTIQGYAALFAALKWLALRDRAAGESAEWRLLFKAVHAKSSLDEKTAARYRDDLYDLFAENLYDAEDLLQDNTDAVNFGMDDKNSPHWPLTIPFHQNFLDFDPVQRPGQLQNEFYEPAYRPFLNGIDTLVAPSEPGIGEAE